MVEREEARLHSMSQPAETCSTYPTRLRIQIKRDTNFLKNSDPLTQFLTQLKAVPIEGERDSYRLEPQAYCTTIERLQQLDTDLWGYVVDKIRWATSS